MDTRKDNASRNRLAAGVRVATLVVVVGTLAAVWRPLHHDATTAAPAESSPVTMTGPDMTAYFPDRFPAPQGPVDPLPSQF